MPNRNPISHFAPNVDSGIALGRSAPVLDDDAMLDLYEWLNNVRYTLFGTLRPCDQQDAVDETFVRAVEFANRLRDPRAVRSACFTIGLRVRAQYIGEYIRERGMGMHVGKQAGWYPERRLADDERQNITLKAISRLRVLEQEIIRRFYFREQTKEQIQDALQLTATQFRLSKHRAVRRVRERVRALLAI